MLKATEGQATVAILGGNPVTGRALESLLRSADYAARFFPEYSEAAAEPLGGARVALILPSLSSRHREALMAMIRATPSTRNLAVIELVTNPNEDGNGLSSRVPWPCSLANLRRYIDEKLPGDPPDTQERRGRDNPRSHDVPVKQYV